MGRLLLPSVLNSFSLLFKHKIVAVKYQACNCISCYKFFNRIKVQTKYFRLIKNAVKIMMPKKKCTTNNYERKQNKRKKMVETSQSSHIHLEQLGLVHC